MAWHDRHVSPSSLSPTSPRARKFSLRLRAVALLATGALGLGTTGCTASVPKDWVPFSPISQSATAPDIVELPALSETEELRDQVVRSDFAIAQAAEELGLGDAALSAQYRVAAGGGLWDPWQDVDFTEELSRPLELPQSVEAAPEEEDALVEFMLETAALQLTALSMIGQIAPTERLNLASILAGRVTSAGALEAQFDSPVKVQIVFPDASEDAALSTELGPPQSGSLDASDQIGQAASSPSQAQAVSLLADALITYDCAASTLLWLSGRSESGVKNPATVARLLQSRALTLDALGVPDARGARCLLDAGTTDEVFEELMRTDLALASAGSESVRKLAVEYLFEDARLWGQSNPGTANQQGISTHVVEEGADEDPQTDPEGQNSQDEGNQ